MGAWVLTKKRARAHRRTLSLASTPALKLELTRARTHTLARAPTPPACALILPTTQAQGRAGQAHPPTGL